MKFFNTIIITLIATSFLTLNAHEGCKDHNHKEHQHNEEQHKHEEHQHAEHTHSHGENCSHNHESHDSNLTLVEVGEKALMSMRLSTVHPQKRRMKSTMSIIGRMELASDARKDAPSPVAGRISIKVCELDTIKKGDVLFTIDSPEIKTISHEIEILRSRLDVYRKLKTTNAEIEANLKMKISQKNALTMGFEEKGGVIIVRSSIDAMVEKTNIPNGAWVETGAAAVSLVRTKALRFRGITVSSEAAKLYDGMKILVDGIEAELRLGIGEANGTTPIYAIFKDGTAPGRAGERMKAECVLSENEKESIAIPDECIVNIGSEPTIFIRDEHNVRRFIAVKIQTGVSNGGWTELVNFHLPDHTEIIKDGVYELKLQAAAKTNEKPIGHFHADGTFHDGEH